MNRTTSLALATALLLGACAAPPQRYPDLEAPGARVEMRGYSFLAFEEPGWQVVHRSGEELALRKAAADPDESYVLQSALVRLGAWKDSQDFLEKIRQGQTNDVDPRRHRELRQDVQPYAGKGTECVKSTMSSLDTGALRPSRRQEPMRLLVLVLSCAHPADREMVVVLGYSHRHYPGHEDAGFAARADALFDSLTMTSP